jgi:subtilisin family serine protease
MPNSFSGRDAGLRRILLVCLFGLAVVLFAFMALPPSSRATLDQSQAPLRKRNNARPEFVPGEVLVRFKSEAAARSQSKSSVVRSDSGRTMSVQLESSEGLEIVEGLRIAHVHAEDTMAAIGALSKQPDVLYAEPNYILHRDNTPNDPNFPSLYGMTKIDAPTAWNTTTGSASVVIGIVDEGIDLLHPDLQANIWTNPVPGGGSIPGITGDVNGYNFASSPRSGTIPPEDHATHVAGIAGAVGNNGTGVVGVNWNVKLMSLRALDATGGSTADAISAYSYASQMRNLWLSSGGGQGANVRVLNNSYGGEGFSQAAFDAISALNQAGILFVASAGNNGISTDVAPHYPSGYDLPNVVSVASTTSSDGLAFSSNFGQTITVGAPGASILSTTPQNQSLCQLDSTDSNGYTYSRCSGTSMASPHVAGAAALICAANPNVSLQQLKALLIFNGDILPALAGKTLTGRRINVAKSLQALTENSGSIDVIPPGAVSNFRVNSQFGRSVNLAWTASGDDGASGQASLYQLTFTDATTGAPPISLLSALPAASGAAQSLDVKIPYRHTSGTIRLRVFDNVGNEGPSATVNISVPIHEGDPYGTTLGIPVALSTGGSLVSGLNGDDLIKPNVPLPFAFPFFGQGFSTVTISSNGNLYFSPAPANDAVSSAKDLSRFKMIAGLWDDLYLGTDQRADAGVYAVQPDANRIIYRWQGVPCNSGPSVCLFGGGPVNFEIELRNDGHILTRYGSGNTNIFPVVGIGGGEPDAYTIDSHTSEQNPTNLTNAQEVTFKLRAPLENQYFFVAQHYRDFLGREPDSGGLDYWSNEITRCGNDPLCIKTRRVGVSAAFFVELEFQRTGSFVYRLYKGGLARRPSHQEFNSDRAQVVEGPNLEATKQALALAFVQRAEFISKYAGQTTAESFVDSLLSSIQQSSNVALRDALIAKYNTGANMNQSRALALRDAIDYATFVSAEYNPAFVLMQYFGYLQRDIDQGGYDFWLGIVNNPSVANYHSMVCAFITSQEYQQRFGSLVTRNDTECAGIQ